jgi:hypothetical protein
MNWLRAGHDRQDWRYVDLAPLLPFRDASYGLRLSRLSYPGFLALLCPCVVLSAWWRTSSRPMLVTVGLCRRRRVTIPSGLSVARDGTGQPQPTRSMRQTVAAGGRTSAGKELNI